MDWESILSSEGALPARDDGAGAGDEATSDMVIESDSVQYIQDASDHICYPLYAYQVKRGKERRNAWHNKAEWRSRFWNPHQQESEIYCIHPSIEVSMLNN